MFLLRIILISTNSAEPHNKCLSMIILAFANSTEPQNENLFQMVFLISANRTKPRDYDVCLDNNYFK